MPAYCLICGRVGEEYSTHRFPSTNPQRQELWLRYMERIGVLREDVRPTSTLCSRHFSDADILVGGNRRRISRSAVPTIGVPAIDANEDMVVDLPEIEEVLDLNVDVGMEVVEIRFDDLVMPVEEPGIDMPQDIAEEDNIEVVDIGLADVPPQERFL